MCLLNGACKVLFRCAACVLGGWDIWYGAQQGTTSSEGSGAYRMLPSSSQVRNRTCFQGPRKGPVTKESAKDQAQ